MFPATPAGAQLGDLLKTIGGEDDLTWSLLEPHFSPTSPAARHPELVLFGAGQLRPLLQQVGVTRAGGHGVLECTALVEAGEAGTVRVVGAVESDAPHLLVGLDVQHRPAGATVLSWEDVTADEPSAFTSSELSEELTQRLDHLLDAQRAAQRIPAVVAAVADADGRLVWWRSLGKASVNPTVAPGTTTTIRTGSIGKTMTAAAVVQLVDEGRMGLDDPINQHLTSYRVAGPAGEQLTVRQLLTHTSGLGARPGAPLLAPAGEVPTLATFYGPELVGQGSPGSFEYSNDAYATLGQLVEDVAGMPFNDYMIERVFDPLGMAATSFLPDERVGTPMTGFEQELDDLVLVELDEIIIRPAGSTLSTTEDMARYAAAMHGRGANAHGRFLSESAFDLLTSVQVTEVGLPGVRGCLGWFRVPTRGGGDALWHNGGLPGGKSELAVLPHLGLTVLVFANAMVRDLDGLCFALANELHT